MKKIMLIVALIVLPLAAFADFQIGGAVYLNIPFTEGQIEIEDESGGIELGDLLFGADVRFNLSIFQAQATVFFSGAEENTEPPTPASLGVYTDLGIVIDLVLIRLGLGVGPNVSFILEDVTNPTQIGANVKASAEIVLGNLSIGLNFVTLIENLAVDDVAAAFKEPTGYFGISVLYKLF